ncbi:hypothetical protein [Neobacillus niacini]|nr:hypothetical protein [Neobacillus niacini]
MEHLIPIDGCFKVTWEPERASDSLRRVNSTDKEPDKASDSR